MDAESQRGRVASVKGSDTIAQSPWHPTWNGIQTASMICMHARGMVTVHIVRGTSRYSHSGMPGMQDLVWRVAMMALG